MSSPVENPSGERKSTRFASQQQEISPEASLQDVDAVSGPADHKWEDMSPEAQAELQQLRSTLQNTVNIQQSRMQHHAFEALSLPGSQPVSRVPSGTNTPQRKLIPTGSSDASPRPSPPTSAIHSPPLTPAASKSQQTAKPATSMATARPPDVMTPQRSTSPQHDSAAPVSSHPKQQPAFSVGPNNDSQPASKDASPAGTPASTAPGTPRAYTPSVEEQNKNKRPSRQADSGDARYRFGNRDPAVGYTTSGSGIDLNAMPVLPRTSSSSSVAKSEDKRSSLFGHHSKKHDEGSGSGQEKGSHHHHSSSKSNLKRFFKFGEHKHKEKDKDSIKSTTSAKDGTKTPPTGRSETQTQPSVPFADDHGLVSKYGKFGKVLGSGAGGSVRLMKRSGDGVVFAVKQFRDRHAYESEREYNKKVTAEFCIGSTLHHGNIIETIDIVHEKGKWYEVMEYAPFDLFATVMTGKMGREEVTCATLQILSGVLYLHSMGLAHRDLKLDNVVISEHGIMKIIDFGSAVVFRYPFENDVVLATGVVGSDPYLAPEVYDHAKYDPRMADIWSIAIIFCCMTLRRFPWKAPRLSDNSYRLFVSPPDADQDKLLDAHRRQQSSTRNSVASTPASRAPSANNDDHHQEDGAKKSTNNESISRQTTASNPDAQPTIKGPSRLLRLLPRETRHIIGRMLELDPRKRATMDEILADPWVQNSLVCRQEENGVVIRAPNHTHTLSPSGGGGN